MQSASDGDLAESKRKEINSAVKRKKTKRDLFRIAKKKTPPGKNGDAFKIAANSPDQTTPRHTDRSRRSRGNTRHIPLLRSSTLKLRQ